MTHHAYLVYELAWALPVIVLQWAIAREELWRNRRAILGVAVVGTLYLATADAIALGHGIWRVSPAATLGVGLGPLPIEEFLFYLLTNIMACQGFLMFAGYLKERKKEGSSR